MDFSESPDVARRKTGILVFYYLVVVVLVTLAVCLAVGFAVTTICAVEQEWSNMRHRAEGKPGPVIRDSGAAPASRVSPSRSTAPPTPSWSPQLFAWVAGCTGGVILLGSLYKIYSQAGGGETVAVMLGGRPVSPETRDPNECKLLDVVKETAIAARTPVPCVYLLEKEAEINAFAAGYTPDDAVIGVTRGCAKLLSRDELAGVIAHEFSHICNGDMRLNMRLMGWLHGIQLIALIGEDVLRSTEDLAAHSPPDSENEADDVVFGVLLGLALLVIGYVGVFFATLIKSAVSRDREFLADAWAVQLTGNPEGLAGALKKIGACSWGGCIEHRHAKQASHLFFASALEPLLPTHPPLEKRIRRIDPTFDGTFPQAVRPRSARHLHSMQGKVVWDTADENSQKRGTEASRRIQAEDTQETDEETQETYEDVHEALERKSRSARRRTRTRMSASEAPQAI